MIRKKTCTWLAPSIIAASSSDIGIESKKPLISHPGERAAAHHQDVAGQRVEADGGDHLADLGEHQVERDRGEELREHLDQQQREQAAATALEPERLNA